MIQRELPNLMKDIYRRVLSSPLVRETMVALCITSGATPVQEEDLTPPPGIVEHISGQTTVYLPLIYQEDCTPGMYAPNDVLGQSLDNTKLTRPVDEDGNGIADEVLQPELCSYFDPERYYAGRDETGNYVRLEIEKDDEAVTDETDYPRNEWREMTQGGQVPAEWKSGVGKHVLQSLVSFVKFAVDGDGKKIETSLLQVHGVSKDYQIRAERSEGKMNIVAHYDNPNGQGKINYIFINDYQEGTVFDAGFTVENNVITFQVNGMEHAVPLVPDTCYFKLGPYQNGDAVSGKTAANVYSFAINHQ